MLGANRHESLWTAGEGAARGFGIRASDFFKETLAAKTGGVRGADEGGQALSRSCAGQQNPFSNSLSVSIATTLRLAGKINQPLFVHNFAILGLPLSDWFALAQRF